MDTGGVSGARTAGGTVGPHAAQKLVDDRAQSRGEQNGVRVAEAAGVRRDAHAVAAIASGLAMSRAGTVSVLARVLVLVFVFEELERTLAQPLGSPNSLGELAGLGLEPLLGVELLEALADRGVFVHLPMEG